MLAGDAWRGISKNEPAVLESLEALFDGDDSYAESRPESRSIGSGLASCSG